MKVSSYFGSTWRLSLVCCFGYLCQTAWCQDMKVSRCAGEGMDVTFSGPFQGVLTVKSTTCQIQVRLIDTSPMIFFVPYGEKCAIKVDALGRAMFTLVIAEQKATLASLTSKVYYNVREVTLLCTYLINMDLNVTSSNRLRMPGIPGPLALTGAVLKEERNYIPDTFESPVISIGNK